MKRLRLIHHTTYHYTQPVRFGPHRVMMRPREGHDVRMVGARVVIEPTAIVRWLRDVEDNSVAILTFAEPAPRLSILAEADVDLSEDNPIECLIDPNARSFPFQ